MSFFRVTAGASPVSIPDLGIVVPALTTDTLSNHLHVLDLINSADLESLIIAGTLACEINYGTGFTAIPAVDYTNRDCIGAYLNIYEITNENNNEKLVNNTDASAGTQLHHHDTRYYTKTQINSTTPSSDGSGLVGFDNTGWGYGTPTTVRAALLALQTGLNQFSLDQAYTQDTDGILNVNGTTKPLDFRSNNTNEIRISRTNGTDLQTALRLAVASNQLQLGATAVGGLSAMNVRVLTDLIVDGNITFTGSITDTTVNELNVTNAIIRMRDGATGIAQADARILVERGTSGTDAALHWNTATNRWRAGFENIEQTIALLEASENVTGVWTFTGAATTDPNMLLTNKTAAPTTNLGGSGVIGLSVINNTLAIYDRTNSRNRWLSVYRKSFLFSGRDSATNLNEYARAGEMTSNMSGVRLMRNYTLVGISAQCANALGVFNARVRRNGNVTNLASLNINLVQGAADTSLNVDLNAGDSLEVYIDGSANRPLIVLELRERF